MASLGDLEREVLEQLWSAPGPLEAKELRDRLGAQHERPALALTTVLTVLTRLERKQFVRRDRSRRPHRFFAARSRDEHVADLMHEALGSAPDRQAALARFVGQAGPDETAQLRRLLGTD
ncbi:BlaI/MecI/CopY family transcriptional regulator [Amnibacterium endophyticum]|uniref:BlaI/MecI/CopY family transcriptional regulator n=1 Tax=Amnibacterium endophyticum TaxID=2109337 RepID=A0ABW4LGN3_9MICO